MWFRFNKSDSLKSTKTNCEFHVFPKLVLNIFFVYYTELARICANDNLRYVYLPIAFLKEAEHLRNTKLNEWGHMLIAEKPADFGSCLLNANGADIDSVKWLILA